MDISQAVLIGLLVAAAGGLGHVVLQWMGRRGWIFYGGEYSAPLGSRSAMALMEFESLLNPAVEHVIEYRRQGDLWIRGLSEPE
ncbi:MAG: hypothetical protein ACFCVC_13145 [Acidimicrobiia bacterium]